MKKTTILYIVIPCYNESECLSQTTNLLLQKIRKLKSGGEISTKSRIVYIDDGSKDDTWDIIKKYSDSNSEIIGLKLSRNSGHQNALLAGLMYAKEYATAVISMDADLQDDINAIDQMLEKHHNGYEIIYGVRSERKTDSFFKRHTAQSFYKIMNFLGVNLVYNAADYRLMSKRALNELANYSETNLFLRGIVPLIGLKWTTVEYKRNKRFAGESKYPLKKMLNFAWDGITSFSIKPLRFVLVLGVLVFFVSIIILIYILIRYLSGATIDGWAFLSCSIWIVGGLQMICVGLIGEYVGKIYAETKQRPKYFIEEIANGNTK